MIHVFGFAGAGRVLIAALAGVGVGAGLGEAAMAQEAASTPDPQVLLGTWDVALYFSASAPPSATVMEISAVNEDGTLAGTFYQSEFEQGRYRLTSDSVVFTVITSDSTGPYATSGRVQADGRIEGQTLSTGRDFLMAWTAQKR